MSEFDIAVCCILNGFISSSMEATESVAVETINNGPPPYSGDIRENVDQVWAEDKWDDERVQEAEDRIKSQGGAVSPFWKQEYEKKSNVFWHEFYKRNTDNFYKDRHYIHIVFPELQPVANETKEVSLLEVGSGVGNAVLPLLEIHPYLNVYAIDIARSAIDILRKHPLVGTGRLHAEVCDVVTEDISIVPPSHLDFVLCMFVLSAMGPQAHQDVFNKLASALKPGGKMLVRDYARYDEAQLRFRKGSKLDDNFYVRQDGTCAYFFAIEEIHRLAAGANMRVEECHYIQRQQLNRKQLKARYRVWLHAKLVKIS